MIILVLEELEPGLTLDLTIFPDGEISEGLETIEDNTRAWRWGVSPNWGFIDYRWDDYHEMDVRGE